MEKKGKAEWLAEVNDILNLSKRIPVLPPFNVFLCTRSKLVAHGKRLDHTPKWTLSNVFFLLSVIPNTP